jgi:nucleoside-triphosphatase THEP1
VLSGVYSRALVHDGEKTGYDLVNISDGSAYPLIRKTPFPNSWQQGRFYFDTAGFEELNSAIIGRDTSNSGQLMTSSDPPADLIVMDEIGLLEIEQSLGLSGMFIHFYKEQSVPMLVTVRSTYLPRFISLLHSLS